MERRFLASLFLYSDEPNELLQNEKPEWNHKTSLPLDEKLEFAEINADAIFPFNSPLSAGISTKDFNFSFLIQPELFARIRPGKQGIVKTKLSEAKLTFNEVNESCFAFANGTKLEQVLQINREVVIQDLNSQRVGELIPVAELQDASTVWDCCAASGGKSIMAYDLLPKIKLTVSDVRHSIIQNLQSRFKEAGITGYRSFVADVTNKEKLEAVIGQLRYDLVICDAPCSGSGTWSRTLSSSLF
jgi:16S rRNA (cytosine967-C5)-methyltransferase